MNFRVRSDPLEFSEKTIYLIYWNFGICDGAEEKEEKEEKD